MRHESAVVKAAFPNLLSLDYFGHVSALTLFLHFAAFYGTWLATFTVWMVVDGLKLPKRGYDTIFHQNMRDTPFLMKLKYEEEERKRRAKENEWKASDVLLYLACHACACLLSVAVYVYSNIELEWIFSNFYFFLTFFKLFENHFLKIKTNI